MIVERIKHNGHIVISDIVENQWVSQIYIDYPIKIAKQKFRQFIKNKEYK